MNQPPASSLPQSTSSMTMTTHIRETDLIESIAAALQYISYSAR